MGFSVSDEQTHKKQEDGGPRAETAAATTDDGESVRAGRSEEDVQRLRGRALGDVGAVRGIGSGHGGETELLSLGSCRWIAERQNLLITGPTGIGKSFLTCAFVERACRRGFTGLYVRAPRLIHELAVSRGDGSYARLLSRLAKLDLLAVDDWLLHPLKESERRDVMEIIEERGVLAII